MFDKRKLQVLLRKGEVALITQAMVCYTFKLKKKAAEQVLRELERMGYVEPMEIDGCWGLAMRGKVLAYESFERVFSIVKQKEDLNKLMERIKLINGSKKFPHLINQVKITSEYPVQTKSTGLKIVFSLIRKEINDQEFNELSRKLYLKSNKPFYNFIDQLSYPETAIYEALKTCSHVLKLKCIEQKDMEKIQGHLLFDLMRITDNAIGSYYV